MTPKYFDIHSHISFSDFEKDRVAVIERMKDAGVFSITVGVDKKSSQEAVACAKKYNNVYATVGLHPTDNTKEAFIEKDYEKLAQHPKVVAIGECGLDYLRIKGDKEEEKKRQKKEFEKQIVFAAKHNKPLMIHCRQAHGDMLDILTEKKQTLGNTLRGNIHFFSESIETAKKYFALDFTISFTGVITFTDDYNEAIKNAPLDMILSETDCPFVAPVPHRRSRNEPVYVREVVKQIANIRGEEYIVVEKALLDNAKRVFSISL